MTKQSEDMLTMVFTRDHGITAAQQSRIWGILRGVEDEPAPCRALYQ